MRPPAARLALTVVLLAPPAVAADPWGSLLGDGCPHPESGIPSVSLRRPAFLGDDGFGVELSGVPAGADAWVLFSWSSVQWSAWPGCEMFVDPSSLLLQPMAGTAPGHAEWNAPLPNAPFLIGAPGFVQAAALGDAIGVSAALSFTMEPAECHWGSVAVVRGTGESLLPSYALTSGPASEPSLPALSFLPITTPGADGSDDRIDVADESRVDLVTDDPLAPRIELRDVGALYRYRATATGETGLLVVSRRTASMRPLVASGAGFGAEIDPTVAVAPDGRRVAAVRSDLLGERVLVAATDGVPLPGAAGVSADVTPAGAVQVDPRSVAFAGDAVVFVARPVLLGASDALHVAPRDGQTAAAAVPLPPLADGSAVDTIDARLLTTARGLVVFAGRSASASDLFAFDTTTGAVANVTQLGATAAIDPLDADLPSPRAALSASGDRLVFTALVGGVREAFVAFTGQGVPGPPRVHSLSENSLFGPTFREFSSPTFGPLGTVVLRVGASSSNGDFYRFLVEPDAGVTEVVNLTLTSGEVFPPYTLPGAVGDGRTFTLGRSGVLFVLRPHPFLALADLVAIDLVSGVVTSLTGSEFGPSGVGSFSEFGVDTVRVVAAAGDVEQRSVLRLTPFFGAARLFAFDAARPELGLTPLATPAFGEEVADVILHPDGRRAAWVHVAAGTPSVRVFEWESGASWTAANLVGVVSRGSLRWLHVGFDTVAYALGTNDAVHPTDAVVEHLALETGARKAVTTTGTNVFLVGTTEEVLELPKVFTANVDETTFGVGRQSTMNVSVKVLKDGPSPQTVTVTIAGDGPTFADGTRTKTVPCQSGDTPFPILAGTKPGCYDVVVAGRVRSAKIHVLKATPTFRTAGLMSTDNTCELKKSGGIDFKLGPGTNLNGNRLTNTMELRFTITPKDGCDAVFDIKRTGKIRHFFNGCPVGPLHSFEDDSNDLDESLVPSKDGNIYSIDGPGPGNPNFGAAGDRYEQHNRFREWVEVENKGRFERLSDENVDWESRVVIEQRPPSAPTPAVHVLPGCLIQLGWAQVDLVTPYSTPSGSCP